MSYPRWFLLVRYHAGDVDTSEAGAVKEHLVECMRCSEVLAELDRRQQEFLRRHPPDQVVPEILAEAERREKSWWWRVRMWWWIRRGDFRH